MDKMAIRNRLAASWADVHLNSLIFMTTVCTKLK